MCPGAAVFLTDLRASVAAYPPVQLLSESVGRQREKSKEVEIAANGGGKKYQRYIFKKVDTKCKDTVSFNGLLSGLGAFLLLNSGGPAIYRTVDVEHNVLLVNWVS